jgi:hypothetical protein
MNTFATLAVLLLGASEARASDFDIVPPDRSFHGKTYSEWAGEWWQWIYSLPTSMDPIVDPTGELADIGQEGPVFFLTGTWGGTATRTVTVPSDKYLFFPIFNTSWVNIELLGDEPWSADARDYAWSVIEPFADAVEEYSCEIDGVSVSDLDAYRTATADGDEYMVTLDEDNYWGIPAFTYGPTIDVGMYILLRPLSPGEHTIHFAAALPDDEWALDVTYDLTVESEHHDGRGRGPRR